MAPTTPEIRLICELRVSSNTSIEKAITDYASLGLKISITELDVTIRGRATGVDTDIGADCTRCGLCVDICPTDSLSFKFKGLDKVL